jgi:hypothetical protein
MLLLRLDQPLASLDLSMCFADLLDLTRERLQRRAHLLLFRCQGAKLFPGGIDPRCTSTLRSSSARLRKSSAARSTST